jgi:hypothetical protein
VKLKLRLVNEDPWWRWSDTFCAVIMLGSAVGYAFVGKSWFLVVFALVIGSIFGWIAEQEWRLHLSKKHK